MTIKFTTNQALEREIRPLIDLIYEFQERGRITISNVANITTTEVKSLNLNKNDFEISELINEPIILDFPEENENTNEVLKIALATIIDLLKEIKQNPNSRNFGVNISPKISKVQAIKCGLAYSGNNDSSYVNSADASELDSY